MLARALREILVIEGSVSMCGDAGTLLSDLWMIQGGVATILKDDHSALFAECRAAVLQATKKKRDFFKVQPSRTPQPLAILGTSMHDTCNLGH